MEPSKRRYPEVNPLRYHFVKWLFGTMAKVLTRRIEVEGVGHIPQSGSFILATNHLSYVDSPLLFIVTPRTLYFLAGERYAEHWFGPILRVAGAIFVRRGEVDREALRQASAVLEDGHCLAIAVEGTRSKSGALNPGKTGAAYLATRANALIVPVVLWGTEQVSPAWKKFRRASVHVKYGLPFRLPEGRARSEQLDIYTDEIMTTLAAMLPAEYRGAYKDHPLLAKKLILKAESPPGG